MKRIPLLVLTICLLALLGAASVFAQDDESTASLSLTESFTTNAQVEITLNGTTHILTVPVSIDIDATRDLADALLTTATVDRVGDVSWQIVTIDEYTEPFELNSYSTLEPAAGNKLAVVTSQLTNLDSQPFSYRRAAFDRFAYDDLGNFYQEADYQCDDINPGDTRTCIMVFEVPDAATIVGMDAKVLDHARIPFAP